MDDTKEKPWASVSHLDRRATLKAYGIGDWKYDDAASTYESKDSTIVKHSISSVTSTQTTTAQTSQEHLSQITEENEEDTVRGTTQLYDSNGVRRLIPMPTADPRDPLNLPMWRKVMAIGAICLFASLAISGEAIIGALCPIFVLQYAHIDPHLLDNLQFRKGTNLGANPVGLLAGVSRYPIWQVYLIASVPVLVVGVSNYFLVPLSIAVGRRPVILVTGLLAIVGGVWAGFTQSLPPHLLARALQGLGVGTVESLLPLIMQDITFIHQRSRAIAAIWASQGLVIVVFGMFSPMIIAALDWRWIYWITAAAASVAYVGVFFCLPETRWRREPCEMKGLSPDPLPAGQDRPKLDYERYGPFDARAKWGVMQYGVWWAEARAGVRAIVISFFFPSIIFISLLNSAFVAVLLAAGQGAAPILLSFGWKFKYLGFSVVPIVLAAIAVTVVGGWGSDRLSNWVSKKYHGGRREPEVHLINMIIPVISTAVGCFMFGAAGSNFNLHWMVFESGLFFMSFGLLMINIIGSVYVIESFPDWAGPVIVNVSSVRNIVAFGCSLKIIDWLGTIGFITMFSIWASIVLGIGLVGIPLCYFYGKSWRQRSQKYIRAQGYVAGM